MQIKYIKKSIYVYIHTFLKLDYEFISIFMNDLKYIECLSEFLILILREINVDVFFKNLKRKFFMLCNTFWRSNIIVLYTQKISFSDDTYDERVYLCKKFLRIYLEKCGRVKRRIRVKPYKWLIKCRRQGVDPASYDVKASRDKYYPRKNRTHVTFYP